jgi:opacity protein-like surface antigen
MKIQNILLAGAVLCALSSPALANEVTSGDVYARLSAGAIMPNDTDATLGASTITYSFKSGWTASGAIGVWLNKKFTLEGEVGYMSADFDEISSGGVSAAVDGDVSAVLALANANFHFMGRDAAIDPYVGGGVGIARSSVDVNSIGVFTINQSDSSTNGAAQASAGIDLNLGNGTKVGVQYRYLYIDTEDGDTDGFTTNNFTAHLTFAF